MSSVPNVVVDSFANAGLWSAQDTAGAPSTALSLTTVTDMAAPIGSGDSMRVAASPSAGGHRFVRTLPALDISDFTELRWWVRSDRVADGSPSAPTRLRLELGSTALPIGSPGTWHRLVPVTRPAAWELVRVSLDDLPPHVATGVEEIRFTVVDHTAAGIDPTAVVWLDELIACKPRLVSDVSIALVDELDGQLVLSGTPVPAALLVPGAVQPAAPYLKVVIDDVAFSDRRTLAGGGKVDVIDTGYRLQRESVAYDIQFRIAPVTISPEEYVALVELVLDRLAHRRGLVVNGVELPLDRLPATDHDRRGDVPVLRYNVATRAQPLGGQVVVPVSAIDLATEAALP
jgi:hypothetical protein